MSAVDAPAVPATIQASRPLTPWPISSLPARLGGPANWARKGIIGFVGAMLLCGAVLPITGASIASGVVNPEGSRKTIQHLEGGIVKAILAKDGDRVEAGQTLIEMDDTQPRAVVASLETQWLRLRAMKQRLLAVQNDEADIVFDADILAAAEKNPDFASFLANERRLVTAGLGMKNGQDEVLRQQIEQSKQEIVGLEAVVKGLDRQLELIQQELDGLKKLEKKGLVPHTRVLEMERAAAGIEGDRAANISSIARARERIAQIEVQRIAAKAEFERSQSNEILNTNSQLAEIEEKLTAARDVLARTKVTAPVTGLIVNNQLKSPGAVLRPGEPFMEIVPTEVDLIISAKLLPTDIDSVHPGQMADITLTAYAQRYSHRLQGKVTKISADTLVDEATRMHYFQVTVVVDRDELKRFGPEVVLSPGMPVEVFIDTGHRTILGYLFEPITRTMDYAFRDE